MKILNIITFVLISGILSSIAADDDQEDELIETVPHHVYMLGYVNTTVEDIEKFDIALCEKNGGTNSYAEHKKSRKRYDKCMDSLYGEIRDEIEIEIESSPFSKDYYEYKSYCRRITKMESCLKNFTESMKTCFDPTKHESADVVYNTASSVSRYLCDNEGGRIRQFLAADGNDCMSKKIYRVTQCANQTVMKYIQSTISNGAEIGGLGIYHLLVPDVEKCTQLDKFHHCTIDELKSCKETLPNMANELFNLVKKVTGCNRFVKSQASLSSIVNALLITAVMAISLRIA